MLLAYQKGLLEGHWQERCNQYMGQIATLTENLKLADEELQRLTTLFCNKKSGTIEAESQTSVSAYICSG